MTDDDDVLRPCAVARTSRSLLERRFPATGVAFWGVEQTREHLSPRTCQPLFVAHNSVVAATDFVTIVVVVALCRCRCVSVSLCVVVIVVCVVALPCRRRRRCRCRSSVRMKRELRRTLFL